MAKGLGDVIANITTAVGIKPCAKCNERKETLNRLFPFSKPFEFTKSETKFLKEFFEWYQGLPIPIEKVKDIEKAEKVWLRVFNVKTESCKSCGSQYQTAFIKDLKKLYDATLDN
jgi:hypothetical protein